jgi:hypothetical protein
MDSRAPLLNLGLFFATLERGGHFLALDRPQELRDLIVASRWTDRTPRRARRTFPQLIHAALLETYGTEGLS